MAVNLGFLKRLIKEDFAQKDQELIGKVGSVLNPALEAITNVLNRGMTVGDLNAQVKTITVTVGSDGIPVNTTTFRSTLNGKCAQIMVGRAINLTTPGTYPTSCPLVSFTQSDSDIIIQHVTGLQANQKYQLTLTAYV